MAVLLLSLPVMCQGQGSGLETLGSESLRYCTWSAQRSLTASSLAVFVGLPVDPFYRRLSRLRAVVGFRKSGTPGNFDLEFEYINTCCIVSDKRGQCALGDLIAEEPLRGRPRVRPSLQACLGGSVALWASLLTPLTSVN